ncbi:MAG: hypothetical protein KDK00_06585 [Rhodobacteraceae bacterium]|nr:hypothetical protein [Paracoccaceae bacterium]
MTGTFDDFLAALRLRESSGDYTAVNTLGYLGAYQFGEAALVDLGVVNLDANPYDNQFNGGFTGTYGLSSRSDFLGNSAAQDAIALAWFDMLWARIRYFDIEYYTGQTLDQVTLSQTGMLAASHLLGTGRLIDFIETGGKATFADAYGTGLTDYLTLFANYEAPAKYLDNLDNSNALDGGRGRDRLVGHGGEDELRGKAGRDVLAGGAGDDTLYGGRGADRLTGGRGDDRLSGGAHADRFIFNGKAGRDIIRDFEDGIDLMVIRGGDLAFDALTIRDANAGAIVEFADTTIVLRGLTADQLSADDFLFS